MRERSLLRLAYVLGSMLVVLPLVDLAANAWPWTPTEINWRYGSYTLVSGFLTTPVIGLALMVGAAVIGGHRRTGRAAAVLAAVLALGLLAASGLFALDALQLNATVPEAAIGQFRIGAAKALLKNLVMAGVLGVIAVVAWRRTGPRRSRGAGREETPLVSPRG